MAKRGDGLYSQTMPLSLGDGKAVAVKDYIVSAWIGKLQHNAGSPHHPAPDLPLLRGQQEIGMDGIFQGICQDNRKLSFVHREGVGQGNICLHRDILILRLVKIGGKHSIQNRRTAPSDQFVFIQPSLGGLQEVQGGFFFPPGYHLHHSLDAMAQVMAFGADHVLCGFYRFHPALERGQLQCGKLCVVPGFRLLADAGEEKQQNGIESHHQQGDRRLENGAGEL